MSVNGRKLVRREKVKHYSLDELPLVTPKVARYHGNPVLTRGGSGAWDEDRVDNPCVLWDFRPNENEFKMWYSGEPGRKTGLAHSTDGINWTKDANNPVFNDPEEQGYADHKTCCADVISLDRTGSPPIFLMVYEQEIRDADGNIVGAYLKFAESSDGVSWTILGKVTDFEKGVRWDGGRMWIDRDNRIHLVASKNVTSKCDFHHFISSDFDTWSLKEVVNFSHELKGNAFHRVDDLNVEPMGGMFFAWANFFINAIPWGGGRRRNRLKCSWGGRWTHSSMLETQSTLRSTLKRIGRDTLFTKATM